MDSLALQRSLAILEDRYRELRETGERRFQTWKLEKDALLQQAKQQKEALQHIREIRETQVKRISSLQAELKTLQEERDAAHKKQETLHHHAEQLKQQLQTQSDALQQETASRVDLAKRLEMLESDLKIMRDERDAVRMQLQETQQTANQLKQQLTTQKQGLKHLHQLAQAPLLIQP